MDQSLLGETTAKLMDHLSDSHLADGEIIAVGIVVIVQKETEEGPMTFTRTMSNEDIHHRVLGLFREGWLTIERGALPEEDES